MSFKSRSELLIKQSNLAISDRRDVTCLIREGDLGSSPSRIGSRCAFEWVGERSWRRYVSSIDLEGATSIRLNHLQIHYYFDQVPLARSKSRFFWRFVTWITQASCFCFHLMQEVTLRIKKSIITSCCSLLEGANDRDVCLLWFTKS